jgi:hypothetical protein
MASDPTRLDLVRSHAADLRLTARSEIDSDSLAQLLLDYGISDAEGKRFALFYTGYRRSRTLHHCLGTILQVEPKAKEYQFRLTYSLEPLMPPLPPETTRTVFDMVDTLADTPEEQTFACRAGFRYPANRYTSCIALPLIIASPARVPYTDIRGLHVAQIREGASLYDAVIDHTSPGLEVVQHSITFEYLARFALDLPSEVLRFAGQISGKFGELHE